VMEFWTDPLPVLIATAFLGTVVGLFLWPRPRMLKIWMLLVTLAILLTLIAVSRRAGPAAGMPLLYLLPLAAFVSLLAQPAQEESRISWLMTLILLGLGLGFLVSERSLGLMLLVSLLALLSLLLYRYKKLSRPQLWWGVGIYGLGIGCLVVSLVAAPPISSVALLLTYSVLLPLFPFHGGYVAALAGLPGNVSAFLALLLPTMGFHGVLTLIPDAPVGIMHTLLILAVSGALYGSAKAMVQCRVVNTLAYASLAFFSILWWYLTTTLTYTPQAAVYLSAVGLVTGGLFLTWHSVQVRYGDVDVNRIGGLARPMPQFATLLSLLVMAAMGLPPFGVFSGYMGMLLNPSIALSGFLLVIMVTWLAASWYFLSLLQRILFGRHRQDIRYEDLRHTETASLLIILLILVAIGIVPARFFEAETPTHGYGTAMESNLWKK